MILLPIMSNIFDLLGIQVQMMDQERWQCAIRTSLAPCLEPSLSLGFRSKSARMSDFASFDTDGSEGKVNSARLMLPNVCWRVEP